MTHPVLPIRTVVKFYFNHNPTNGNKLVSKTMLKTAFIDNEWLDANTLPPAADEPADVTAKLPQDGEFWLVDVVRETCPGQSRGCFLVHPIQRVMPNAVTRLVQGMYAEESKEGILVLTPKSKGRDLFWILPLKHKKSISDANAIIVAHQ